MRPSFDYSLRASHIYIERRSFYGARGDNEQRAWEDAGFNGEVTPEFIADNQAAIDEAARRVWGLTENHVFFLDSQFDHYLASHTISYGLQYRYEDLTDGSLHAADITPTTKDGFGNAGIYLQDQWAITSALELVPGIRIDDHDHVSDIIVSPRLAARYFANDVITMRASWSTGFNAPGAFNEDKHIGVNNGGAIFLVNEPGLKEERSQTISFGAEYQPVDLECPFVLHSQIHYTRLHDTLEIDDSGELSGDPTLWLRYNGPDSTIWVWENNFNWSIVDHLRTSAVNGKRRMGGDGFFGLRRRGCGDQMGGMERVELASREFGGPGGAPEVVLLHGLLGSSRNWQTAGRKLAERFRVAALDLRNHGESPQHARMDYPSMAADVLGWLAAAGGGAVHLVGHSMGGKVAMWLACGEPERVKTLTVVDIAPRAYPPRWEREFAVMRRMPVDRFTRRSEAEEWLAEDIRDWAFRKFLVSNLERDPEGGFRWMVNLEILEAALPNLFRHVPVEGQGYAGPTLFLRGGKSRFVDESDRPLMRRCFPASRLETIEAAGHNVHFDEPDAFVAAIRRHVEEAGE